MKNSDESTISGCGDNFLPLYPTVHHTYSHIVKCREHRAPMRYSDEQPRGLTCGGTGGMISGSDGMTLLMALVAVNAGGGAVRAVLLRAFWSLQAAASLSLTYTFWPFWLS